MIAVLLLALLLNTPPSDPYGLARVETAFLYDGVRSSWYWDTCGQQNAYYHVGLKRVRMCNELRTAKPGVIRWIFAHELAHGVINQRGIALPADTEEIAADQLATIVMLNIGHEKDVLEAADYWLKDGDENLYDSHPAGKKRWATLTCMVNGRRGDTKEGCSETWIAAVRSWNYLLRLED